MSLRGGQWHNEFNFVLKDTGQKVPGFPKYRKRTLYEYTADYIKPMTFQSGEREFWQPDRHGFSDMGSVPEALQWAVPKDLHLPSFILHDSACREHGLYFSQELDGEYKFTPIGPKHAAKLLGMGLRAAGYKIRARIVRRYVIKFGPTWRMGGQNDSGNNS